MKINLLFITLIALMICSSCTTAEKPIKKVIDESLASSVKQYNLMTEVMNTKDGLLPRSSDAEGKFLTEESSSWTSGFYPGTLWYLYEYSNDPKLKEDAQKMTARIEKEKNNRSTHDIGFMLYCSFGNGIRIAGDDSYNEVLLTGAKSLCTRFRPNVGCLQSWGANKKWQYPVIIDNMMNLELLMWAFDHTGDSTFYNIAVSHADTTLKNHFRPDFSTYHVVSYDTITGLVEAKQTAQGYSDESAWARGQSWGLYGYTMMYRKTGLQRYLKQAEHIADFLINNRNMPDDKIPYWDYNAPDIPNAQRDASAGAIMASALVELNNYVAPEKGKQYLKVAEKQIRTLASPSYMAKPGQNSNFILMHSVGSKPANSEVDVALPYADYYFVEAMMRYRKLLK